MAKRRASFSNGDRPVWFVILLFGLLFGVGSSGPLQAACGGSPIVVTDKPDYGPTETVVISGTGFNCGEVVSVLVTAPDGSIRSGDGTGAAGPDTVVTDDNGAFSLRYSLSGTLPGGSSYEGQRGVYRVEVRDGSSMMLADTTFSDGVGGFSCALTDTGGVKCWGNNQLGQLGIGIFTPQLPYGGIATPVDVTGLPPAIVQVTVGSGHACALTTAGGVKCWGRNNLGELPPTGIATPVDVPGLTSGVTQITAGSGHVCALTTAGGVKCWGDNLYAQLGNDTFIDSPTPIDIRTLTSGVAQISAGGTHTCALTTAGGVKCWGGNYSGQLGDGTFKPLDPTGVATPVDVIGLTSGVAQISAGGVHTCALTMAGGVKCWGWNAYGQLGSLDTFTGFSTAPVDVDMLTSGVAQISTGQVHTCALTTPGGVKCWGSNHYGQLGNGVRTDSPTPVDVSGLTSGIAQISAGGSHNCAMTTTGGVKCWGDNYYGQVGNGEFTTDFWYPGITTPVDVIGLTSGVAGLWDAAPLVPWTFSGFYHPVEMGGALNTVKGGSTVPIKFQVFAGATELTEPSIVVQPLTATQTLCSGGGPTDTIDLTATGATSLRYDSDGGYFIYNWKTPKMAGYCYTVTVALTNGASLSANFALR